MPCRINQPRTQWFRLSRINLRGYGEDLTSRYYVVSRETLFQSPVALTPYASDERIDDVALGAIIEEAYAAAGVAPRDIMAVSLPNLATCSACLSAGLRGVHTGPGAIAFTRMPRSMSCAESERVKA